MSENPYQSPESTVLDKKNIQKSSKSILAWKVYFWLNFALAIITLILFPISMMGLIGSPFSFFDALDFIIWLPSLLAIFGVAWLRSFFNIKFWKIYFYVFITWNIFYGFIFTLVFGMESYGTLTTVEDLAFEIPFIIIHLYLFYRYAYKMDYLWLNNDQDGSSK